MNSAFALCGLAMVCYGLEIAVADWKLSHVSPRVLTLCYSFGVGSCAAILVAGSGGQRWPQGREWGWTAVMAGLSFLAAFAHFAAIAGNVGAAGMTLVYSLLPIVAAAFSAIVRGELPTTRSAIAWALATAALVLEATAPTAPSEP